VSNDDQTIQLAVELRRLEETRRALAARLELTATALALTLDAQASTRQRLDSMSGNGAEPRRVAQLEAAADRYRQVIRMLTLNEHAVR
jgi:hypothetical protein